MHMISHFKNGKHQNCKRDLLPDFGVSSALDQEGFSLTLRRLMSYIYMEHPFLMFLDHTQRRSTVGRTPLDE